ncbi:MAG: DUF2029 domain-containing protein [Propionibacteriaceae bacterium]|jgi:hypothetical protein|nr:DUF2029 domain-containing protein [Propionibacteriaceae bacterium]
MAANASAGAGRWIARWNWAISRLRLTTGRKAVACWAITRGIIFAFWGLFGFYPQGDVDYYYRSIRRLFLGLITPEQTLIEYPTPLIWILSLPYLIGAGNKTGFLFAFIVLFLATDALVAWLLWRTARKFGTDPNPAVLFWIGFVLAMGPITYMRLDLLTAALGAAAVLALVRGHRASAGVMIGLGASIKLWPALLWPATMVDRRAVWRATWGIWSCGAVLVAASLLYAGWDRLLSPLTWQAGRGLQIESIYATPIMLARLFAHGHYDVSVSRYQAFEIAGPGSPAMVAVASAATALGGLTMLALYLGWLRRHQRTAIEAGTLMIIATLIMIITNKTFSPQYMMWLAGPVAGLLTISARRPTMPILPDQPATPMSLARQIGLWTLALTALTQLVYPTLYGYLVTWSWLTPLATVVLAARNLALLYFSIRLIRLAFRSIAWRPRGEPETPSKRPLSASPSSPRRPGRITDRAQPASTRPPPLPPAT